MSPRVSSLLQALVVVVIWSASWVLIKIGLDGIPPIMFAGLRYGIAFLCLLAVVLRSRVFRAEIAGLTRREWIDLIALGVVAYALAQGAQFAALGFLPSVTLSLILNFTSIAVAGFAYFALGEVATRRQWFGIGAFLVGVLIYFAGQDIPAAQFTGLAIGTFCMLSNAAGGVMGRAVNRDTALSAVTVTVVSMGVGAVLMLAFGFATEGLPPLTGQHWAIIVWLAVVHTAVTFVIWNQALRHLTAIESSVINGLMLIFIAILAWMFLGEAITPQAGVGLVFAALGIVLVQLRGRRDK